ncbi:hypothetical protein ACN42_g4559 [Penicillium freii]|uniref:Uncharacterized protein n=1 Tax=Penicillium freii TaxID=48697 RepID=A0A101ML64_PENFR|nr:hypothetical protein ACN42_g4559 [Penicillium freii]
MFKTGCLYSAHAFFLRDVVHRASIKLELALNLKSHIHKWKDSRCLRPSGGKSASGSALLPSAGKTSFSSRWLVPSLFSFINQHPPPVIFSF